MEAPPQKRRAGGRVLETKTYRPTLAEFRDPYVYIASIRAEGERYGIVRIVPPKGWEMDCYVDFEAKAKIGSKRQRVDLLMEGDSFDDGGRYTLSEYAWMADAFAKSWVRKTHPKHFKGEDCRYDHDLLEVDYWDIVDRGDQGSPGVVVDYGNDVDAAEYWSGFPRGPPQPELCAENLDRCEPFSYEYYARSGWNLNNIARWPGSVLRYYEEPVSGVTSPWLYLGMLFSTFPWHNEDNYFYSINYHHAGAPKQWYGTPGSKADAFEVAFRALVNENGGDMTAGDSLHNINTMISAYEIAKRGVPMYALRQMPGEFVVTFPRAYHGGFSLGFNIGEAVNFATPDWVQHARLANEHYRTIARLGVVGHDRLMFTLAHNVDTYTDIASCEALRGEVWRIAEEEARTRPHLYRTEGLRDVSDRVGPPPGNNTRVCGKDDADFDDTRICCICKHTCYASIVGCNCSNDQLVCLRHAGFLCRCPPSNRFVLEWEKVEDLIRLARRVDAKLAQLKGVPYVPAVVDWPMMPRTVNP